MTAEVIAEPGRWGDHGPISELAGPPAADTDRQCLGSTERSHSCHNTRGLQLAKGDELLFSLSPLRTVGNVPVRGGARRYGTGVRSAQCEQATERARVIA